MTVTTINPEGDSRDYSFECGSHEKALSIVKGTLEGCELTGWKLVKVEMS